MDKLQAMTMFVAVVDEAGFASAARRLNVSPSVVTRAVGDLEERLGLRLLSRTTRTVRVTDAGANYARDCRRILGEIDEAEDAATGTHSTPRGHITLTASVLFGQMYVMPIVTLYLQRHPEVNAACWFVDRVVNMVDEGVDVAVRIGDLPDSSLHAVRVGRVRRVICGSPRYLAEHGVPQRPEDLDDHVIVSATGVTPSPQWNLSDAGESRTYKLRPRMTTTTYDSAIAAAVDGFGLTRLMSYQVATQLESGALKTVLTEFELPPLPIHVVHREGRGASRKVRAFLDLAIAQLRADPSLN